MERSVLSKAAEFMLAQRRHKRWQKAVSGMAAVVVFCTTYALILPAITLSDDTLCGLEEHAHTEACWTTETRYPQSAMACILEENSTPVIHVHDSLCRSEDGTLICELEELEAHRHDSDCYREKRTLICGETEDLGHSHSGACYTSYRGEMTCTQEEDPGHSHSDSCYDVSRELTCSDDSEEHVHDSGCYTETRTLTCTEEARPGHSHSDSCYAWTQELTCTQEERSAGHVHSGDCYEVSTYLDCDLDEVWPHSHSDSCYDEAGDLICGQEEVLKHQHTADCIIPPEGEPWEEQVLTCGLEAHSHSVSCYPEEEVVPPEDLETAGEIDSERVAEVTALIEALPTAEEIDAALAAYDEAGDWDGYEAYYREVSEQALSAYVWYEDLSEEERALVTNADKLLELEWLWSASTLQITQGIDVYQANAYANNAATLTVYGKSADDYGITNMDFAYWSAITVEKNEVGQWYVDDVVTTSGEDKSTIAPSPTGFVLLVYHVEIPIASLDIRVGDLVTVSFDPTATVAYTGTSCGTIYFEHRKDNSDKLTIVESADTLDLIEVNLYDYGTNINAPYESNNKHPGFQQDEGTTTAGLSKYGLNFGNNITEDLAAGKSNVTNQGGDINATASEYNGVEYGAANLPIEGAMLPTLQNGYPALADGTSLQYLFHGNSGYATKKNTANINGLFIHNPTTGAYTFNSRENHAQFNAEDNTFTLYDQLISSNVIMYPFGNFLPFNDIVHLSAQASTMDRAYLQSIAESAQYKYQQNMGDAYSTLATELTEVIALMDAKYGTGWAIADAMNEYFGAAGLPPQFSQTDPLLEKVYSIDYDEPTDFYFGMEIKMEFMQPKNGLTGNDGKQPMIFYFTGDDDVWVYIDDILFLDLSGIHRHVGGEIDFVNGLVHYYVLDPGTGDVTGAPYKTVTFAEILGSTAGLNANGTFEDYSHHSFNFYYTERGAGSGVCRMNFNFPLLRKNSIAVRKELSVDEAEKLDLLGNPDFRFQVLDVDESGNKTNALFISANTPYRVLNEYGNEVGTGRTDANGVFTLKAGQTAEFSGIDEDAGKYYVRELLDANEFAQYGSVSVNGASTTTVNNVTVGSTIFQGLDSSVLDISDGTTIFSFNNQVTFNKLGKLVVEKHVVDYIVPMALDPPRFTMHVTLDGVPLPVGTEYKVGDEIRTVEEAGCIMIAHDERAEISNILSGTAFEVWEDSGSAEGYTVVYSGDEGTTTDGSSISGVIRTDATVSVLVTNSEEGAFIPITIHKTLLNPDSAERTFSFTVEQVDADGSATVIDPDFQITLEPGEEQSSDSFVLTYIDPEIDTLPATYTYRITESTGEPGVVYDDAVYLVTVEVSQGTDGLTAEITSVTKDGVEVTDKTITFQNEVVRYTLPETGGAGTGPYAMAGLLTMLGAAYLLYKDCVRRKEGTASTS